MSSHCESGSPNRREEGSNSGCLALQSGEEVTEAIADIESNPAGIYGMLTRIRRELDEKSRRNR